MASENRSLETRQFPPPPRAKPVAYCATILVFSVATAAFAGARGDWAVAGILALGAAFFLLVIIGLLFVEQEERGYVIRLDADHIEITHGDRRFPNGRLTKVWPWAALTSVERVDLVFEPVPGTPDHLIDSLVRFGFSDGSRWWCSLAWLGGHAVGSSLLARRFDAAATMEGVVPKVEAVGPKD